MAPQRSGLNLGPISSQQLSDLGSSLSVKIEPNSLFLSIAASVGKPIITKIKCCIHDGFVYFPYLTENSDFFYYIFMSGQPYLGLGKLGTQLNLNTDTVGGIFVGLPPKNEQSNIVEFLNAQNIKIDAIKDKLEKAITHLQEYRSAIITNAVTGKIDLRSFAEQKEPS